MKPGLVKETSTLLLNPEPVKNIQPDSETRQWKQCTLTESRAKETNFGHRIRAVKEIQSGPENRVQRIKGASKINTVWPWNPSQIFSWPTEHKTNQTLKRKSSTLTKNPEPGKETLWQWNPEPVENNTVWPCNQSRHGPWATNPNNHWEGKLTNIWEENLLPRKTLPLRSHLYKSVCLFNWGLSYPTIANAASFPDSSFPNKSLP